MRFSKTLLVFALLLLSLGCSTLANKSSTGVIVARRAQIRSSTAVVAADLLQVNRGDVVDILEATDVNDPSDNSRKERWLRVKARDSDTTEGWIEARNVMPDDVLKESEKLAAEDKDITAQATGQLRASSNLRLSPDRSGNENIMMRLDSGSSFDIIGWKRVPKPKSSEAIETDVAPKSIQVRADFDWPQPDSRREFLRVKWNAQGGLELFPTQDSAVLTSTAWADGLVDNPAGRAIRKGEPVRFLPYSELYW